MKHYGNDGISVMIVRQPKADKVMVVFGDWNGNNLELDSPKPSVHKTTAIEFANNELSLFLNTMKLIRLEQAQLFLSFSQNGLILTDIQISPNKLCGPGMVRDLFGKNYRVPDILKIEPLDDRSANYIEAGTGTYEGDLIIKPSKFSLFDRNGNMVPLVAEIKRLEN